VSPSEGFAHPEPQGPPLGFVLCDAPIDLDALVAALSDELPGGVSRHPMETGDGPGGELLAVDAQGVTLLLAPVASPVPDQAALNAAHPVWWPDTAPVAAHTDHLVITVARPQGAEADHEEALHEAVLFSVVATIVLEAPQAVALFYGNGGITLPAGPYCEMVTDALESGHLPVEAWVSAWLTRDAEGRFSGRTVGLDAFGHAELMVRGSEHEASDVYGLLISLAAHIAGSGDRLQPGAFVGPSADERYEVFAEPDETPLLRIAY
jgi:hypothetical protein